jgi:hypothetical protein
MKCSKCLVSYPDDNPGQYFYPVPRHKNKRLFASYCIACEKKICEAYYTKKRGLTKVKAAWSIRRRLAFHSKLNKRTNCLEWQSGLVGKYGYLNLWDKHYTVHRLAYEVANEPITNGLWVLHKCDNPICINPKHLFLGTRADNIADMVSK